MEKRGWVLSRASDFPSSPHFPWFAQGFYPGRHLPVSGQTCSTLDLLLYHEDGDITFLRSVGRHLAQYTVSDAGRQ
jgi:hypothetical protein